MALLLSYREARRTFASPLVVEELADQPLVIVDLTVDGQGHEPISVPPGTRPVVAAVVRDGAEDPMIAASFDVVLANRPDLPRAVHPPEGRDAGLALLERAVTESPLAASLLVQHLRLGANRSPLEGLVAESMTYSLLRVGPEFTRWLSLRGVQGHAGTPGDVTVRHTRTEVEIRLHRPARHNAVDVTMRDRLVEVLSAAAIDPGRPSVRLAGEGPSFSSGGELTEFGSSLDAVQSHLVRLRRSPAGWLERLRPRLSARIHGACVGAGIEMAAFATEVVAAMDTQIRLPELAMGLIPGAGGTVSVTRRIGRQRMAWLALTGASLDATTAQAWGLVDSVEA